ncbi:ABC transporter ATP-binding protein [Azorhizobium caulinodans ORS 571]|uniref:ABC transporter ATP-binding protein n=1 Tax=Azorhizobium caulinodans (strain ATCC 43989 / DSM 5975 / JCM 20966 / LMG 6465 / NBRC 14845 / NCIMB 13405 / ORS 571) TaxID=438753 RepID=A8I6V4_AZOC5|nr:ABC transporter ATP-binding protein [Azorhizobium caulinodans]BAF88046.1 ABC transporter ATP-binding protein [Azorhizobium caulinodans ORS 571]
MSEQPILSVSGLAIQLPAGADRLYAVEHVSFDIHRGETLAIVGESGSGKSMSANAVMGLLPPGTRVAQGQALLEGEDVLRLDPAAMRAIRGRRIGMIFQEPMTALDPLMRVGEQIAEVFEAHGLYSTAERRARALALLTEVGIPEPERAIHAYPFQLSGGQRQRVMIAMALALDPVLLIADEPTTALDVTTQAQILKLIRELQEKHGTAVMFITHDFGVVADIADRVVVMRQGRVVETGTATDVLGNPQHEYTQALIAAIPTGRAAGVAAAKAERQVVLEVKGLTKTYTSPTGFLKPPRVVHAVRDVSFTLARGETLGVVGESGSGKSSLGRCLVRLIEPDGGSIRVDGQETMGQSAGQMRLWRRRMQMVFQDPYGSLNPRTRVGRIIAEGPIAAGVPVKEALQKAGDLLKLVGLDPSALDRFPHEFSGGQRQRIGIARALALDPEIIIADEAVSALDVSIQAQVLRLLADLKVRLNLALVFITHDLRVAATICDTVAVMRKGEVVEMGPAADIFGAPKHEYTRRLIEAIPGRSEGDAFGARAAV